MSDVNKKEYLKRYISKKKDKKKKKKVPKGVQSRVKIIDDNIDVHEQVQTIQDIENDNEDAPQVVAVIDDRPVELRLNKFKDQSNWTLLDRKPQVKEEPESPERNGDISPRRKGNADESPPRRSRKQDSDESPPRIRKTDDASPPRKSRKNDSDESPPRSRRNNDTSPPRKSKTYDSDESPPRRQKHSNSNKSPPRNRKNDSDESPPRRYKGTELGSAKKSGNDQSPSRRSNRNQSPPRRKSPNRKQSRDRDESPPRRHRDRDASPPPHKNQESNKKSRWASKSPSPEQSSSSKHTKSNKATKTLDGKTAGLQNAKDLVTETQNFKKREAKLFEQMASEVSGVNASTVMRDRKTGKVRDLEAEAQEKSVKNEKANELQKTYDKWGKGVKQTADYQEKLQAAAYEMSKPLARYADDVDLEKHLKEQERIGDPMLQYIKKKKREVAVKSGVKLKPEYMGEFMPNRFGIRPGHRWDGVDRSNGYEKKWFDAINQRNADREEAYKWNSEDM